MRPFIGGTVNVREPGSVNVLQTNLFTLFDVIGTRAFTIWNYNGSLTTPSKFESSFYENIFYVFSSDCNEAVNWMVSRWSQFHFRKLVQTSSNRFTNSRFQSTLWNYKLWGRLKMTQATCFLEITAQFSLWMEEQFIVTNQPNTQLCLLRNKMCFDVHSQQNSTPVTCLNKVYSEFVLTTN